MSKSLLSLLTLTFMVTISNGHVIIGSESNLTSGENFMSEVVRTGEITVGNEHLKYKVTVEGNWHLDACTVIGNEKEGLVGIYKTMHVEAERRRLNPYYAESANRRWANARVAWKNEHPNLDMTVWNAAIADYHAKTGVVFVERTTETSWIRVFSGGGCYSILGWSNPAFSSNYNGQDLSLGTNCQRITTVVHEIGHALGMRHTQQRSDRNQWININFANVIADKTSNFDISDWPVCGCYDCGSVMHYFETAFSSNGQKTITPLQSSCVIRRNDGSPLSIHDQGCINIMYPKSGLPALPNPSTCITKQPTGTGSPSLPTASTRDPTARPTVNPTTPSPTSYSDNFCIFGSLDSQITINGYYTLDSSNYNGKASYTGTERHPCRGAQEVWATSSYWVVGDRQGGSYRARCPISQSDVKTCGGKWEVWTGAWTLKPNVQISLGKCNRVICPQGIVVTANHNNPCTGTYTYMNEPNKYNFGSSKYMAWNNGRYQWMCGSSASGVSDNTLNCPYSTYSGGRSAVIATPNIVPGQTKTYPWGAEGNEVYVQCKGSGTTTTTTSTTTSTTTTTTKKPTTTTTTKKPTSTTTTTTSTTTTTTTTKKPTTTTTTKKPTTTTTTTSTTTTKKPTTSTTTTTGGTGTTGVCVSGVLSGQTSINGYYKLNPAQYNGKNAYTGTNRIACNYVRYIFASGSYWYIGSSLGSGYRARCPISVGAVTNCAGQWQIWSSSWTSSSLVLTNGLCDRAECRGGIVVTGSISSCAGSYSYTSTNQYSRSASSRYFSWNEGYNRWFCGNSANGIAKPSTPCSYSGLYGYTPAAAGPNINEGETKTYTWNNGNSIQIQCKGASQLSANQNAGGATTTLLVVISVGGVASLALCLFLYFCCKRRRNEELKSMKSMETQQQTAQAVATVSMTDMAAKTNTQAISPVEEDEDEENNYYEDKINDGDTNAVTGNVALPEGDAATVDDAYNAYDEEYVAENEEYVAENEEYVAENEEYEYEY